MLHIEEVDDNHIRICCKGRNVITTKCGQYINITKFLTKDQLMAVLTISDNIIDALRKYTDNIFCYELTSNTDSAGTYTLKALGLSVLAKIDPALAVEVIHVLSLHETLPRNFKDSLLSQKLEELLRMIDEKP